MATTYRVRITDRFDYLRFEIVSFLGLTYTKRVNHVGMAIVVLEGEHPALSAVDLDWHLQIWRRNEEWGLEWTCDFYGLIRDVERRIDEHGRMTGVLYAPDLNHYLQRAIVGYKTGVENRSVFSAQSARLISLMLVGYNLQASSGTTLDGRVRNVDITKVLIPSLGDGGNTIDFVCSYQNLLSALQEIAAIGGGDFNVVHLDMPPGSVRFEWYAGQMGDDRSDSVVFSMQHGNMTRPVLRRNTLNERTIAIVGGQGEEASRAIEVRTGVNYEAQYNSTEFFVDARNYTTSAGLQGAGDRALHETRARYSLEFDIIQTPGSAYGLHYFLGDLVTARFQEYTATKKIVAVSVELSPTGAESIVLETADA